MKKVFLHFRIISLICIVGLMFSVGIAKIDGNSMKPRFNNNDLIIYKRLKKDIKRFDIIVFKINNELFIKRVIGLPGEKVEYLDNVLYVNGVEVEESFQKSITKDFSIKDISSSDVIPNNQFLVLGDNRLYSYDSRNFGLVDIKNIKGIFVFKII